MRLVLAAAALSAIAAPAMAQSDDRAEAAVHALQNPLVQEGVTLMLGNLAGIVLDTKVGPIGRYADPEHIRRDDTLGDMMRRRDPDFDRHLHADTRRAVAAAATTGGDLLAMRDSLQQTSDRLRAAVAPLRRAIEAQGD